MLLCLSSGYRPRYRHDILRAISMPRGNHLQFRYEKDLVPGGLQTRLAKNELTGIEVCIAYLDRTDTGETPEIIPCRLAILVESRVAGDMVLLDLRLGEFWISRDIQAFNRDVRGASSNLPHWAGRNLQGVFCQMITSVPTSLIKTAEITDWQYIVRALKEHKDFADEPFFYYVVSLREAGVAKDLELIDNAYSLKAGKSYRLRVIQFGPGSHLDSLPVGKTYWLLARSDDEQILFTATNEVAIDSPYDEKSIRFRTAHPTHKTDSALTLLRQTTPGIPEESKAILDFDLHVHIKANSVWVTSTRGRNSTP
jgi:hypothetical protein